MEDPHFLTAKPGFILTAKETDVWIRIGMELEVGWEGPILRDSRNRKIQQGAAGFIDASESVIRLEVPQERVTRDMGDVHPHGNPHYWLDPLNGRIMAKTIADHLGRLYPAQRDLFQGNLRNFEHELDTRMFGAALVDRYNGARLWNMLLEEKLADTLRHDATADMAGGWFAALAPFKGEPVITYHRSWIYLTNRFGLQTPVSLEPKPGVPPGSKHLAMVVKTINEQRIKIILMEPFYSSKPAEWVADRTGVTVIVRPNTVCSSPGADSYLEMLDSVITALAGGPAKP
jgi:ABC-type Zn uptake system ZnuABC Zn-binding protein ZnuA